MGLLAWYPLNGTLEDYSGNGNDLTTNTGVVDNNGKIGKCYSYDGGNKWSQSKATIIYNDCTFCAWVYQTSNSGLQGILSTHNNSTTSNIGMNLVNGKLATSLGYTDGSREYQDKLSTISIPLDTWTHIAITYSNVSKKLTYYINGVKNTEFNIVKEVKFSKEKPVIANWSVGYLNSTYDFIGKVNDARIYDEALSLKEIKEISKAKILHYNFNQFAESTTNMNKNFSFTTAEKYSDYCVKTSADNWYTGISLSRTNVVGGGTYTWSIEVKGNRDFTANFDPNCTATNYTGNDAPIETSKPSSTGVAVKANQWTKVYLTVKIRDDAESPFLHHSFCPRVEVGEENLEIYARNSQVEEKDHYTEYTDGTRIDYVTDSSGFKNHSMPLQLTNTPSWTEDSLLGKGCYKFNGGASIIQATTQNFNCDAYSISLWFNKSDNLFYQGVFQISNPRTMRLMGFENNVMRFHPLGLNNGSKYLDFKYEVGKWYHVVMVIQETLSKLYVNGIKVGEVLLDTTLSSFNGKDILIGRDGSDNGRIFNGYIDDVRIYATALSDEDIAELCQSRGSIAKNGKLMVNEIVENGNYKYESQGINLVRNGYGEYKDNTNMGGTFVSTDFSPESDGVFEYTSSTTVLSSDYIKVNKDDVYKLSMYIKSITENNKYYAGVSCYDKDKSRITYAQVHNLTNTRTTLAKPLNTGDSVVYLTSSVGWYVGTQGTYVHQKQLGVFDRLDATNYERTTTFIKYTNIDTTTHTLTLQSAWKGATIPQGTKVANCYDGGMYNYILGNGSLPMDWTKKEATITGWGVNTDSKFRYGTEYIKILILANYSQESTFKMRVGSVSFINTSQMQSPTYNNKDSSQVNKRGQLVTTEIYENNYKPSLIDYSGWSLTSTDGWSNNGTSSENCRVVYPNPRGNSDIMWATLGNDITSNDDGGFHSPMVNIDKTKKYRFSVWIRRENIGDGRTYFGLNAYDSAGTENGLLNLSDTSITNPYFTNFAKGHAFYDACNNEWCLFVAYVQPSSYSGDNEAENGVYKKDGTRVGGVSGYKWSTTASKARLRAYLYYSTSTAERQYFYRPRIDLCDGSEPTIQELLSCNEHLPLADMSGRLLPKNTFSFGKNGCTYSTEFIEN